MARINFGCSCGETVWAPEALAGKKAKCPKCGRIVVVPDAAVSVQVGTATQIRQELQPTKTQTPAPTPPDEPSNRPDSSNYGLAPEIPVCAGMGPRGAARYFRHLRCPSGSEVAASDRAGAVEVSRASHVLLKERTARPCPTFGSLLPSSEATMMVDRYQIKCACGQHGLTVYVDMYHIALDRCIGAQGWTFVGALPDGRTLRAGESAPSATCSVPVQATVGKEEILKAKVAAMGQFARDVCCEVLTFFYYKPDLMASDEKMRETLKAAYERYFARQNQEYSLTRAEAESRFAEGGKDVLEVAAGVITLIHEQSKHKGDFDIKTYLREFRLGLNTLVWQVCGAPW